MKTKTSFIKGKIRPLQGKRGQGKITRTLKEAILHAFSELGGSDYLIRIGNKNPSVFCGLLAKVLPLAIEFEKQNDKIPAPYWLCPLENEKEK